jgi:hypothetical protein
MGHSLSITCGCAPDPVRARGAQAMVPAVADASRPRAESAGSKGSKDSKCADRTAQEVARLEQQWLSDLHALHAVLDEASVTRPELIDVPRLAVAVATVRGQWREAKARHHALAPALLDVREGWFVCAGACPRAPLGTWVPGWLCG